MSDPTAVSPPPPGSALTGEPVGAYRADDDAAPRASLGEIVSDITSDMSTLMRQEVALAKAELSQTAKTAGKSAGMFSIAAVAGYLTLLFLSIALWLGLGDLFNNMVLGAVVVALLWGVVGALLGLKGRDELREVEGAPQTAETIKKIPNALKGHEEENR